MMEPVELLERAGVLLYGDGWKLPLSYNLRIGTATIYRWLKGERAIPDAVVDKILLLVRKHLRQGHEILSHWQHTP